MGCDIHSRAERRVNGKWEVIQNLAPFDWRQYGMYGFLAGVRNYSDVTPLSQPRGLPEDIPEYEEWEFGDHSYSWLSLAELLAFDYDAEMEDRRVTVMMPGGWMNGGSTAEPGGGTPTTFRSFLGEAFFEDLEKLKIAGAERIVFGFDN